MIEEQKKTFVEPPTGNKIKIQYLQEKFDVVYRFYQRLRFCGSFLISNS